jgi:transposase InsO family protein
VYGIKRLCRVLNVSRSGFYAWLAGATGRAARAIQEERLVEQIRKIHTDTHATYGSPRITVELRAQGRIVNHQRVERLMRQHGLVGRHLRRRHATTRRDPAAQAAPDLLGRDLHRHPA